MSDIDHSVSRIYALDLVRGSAAFAVAIPHFFIQQNVEPEIFEAISIFGVEIFFVLSGFVLAPQLVYCYEQDRASTLGRFLARRWMRTLPPYFVALLMFTVIFDRLFSADFFLHAVFLQNFSGLWVDNNYFEISWSLSVEEWFYIVFPAAVAVLSRLYRPRLMTYVLLLILVFFLARTILADFSDWGPDVRRVVVYRLDSIGLGVLLYLIGERLGGFRTVPSAVLLLLFAGGSAALMAILMAVDNLVAKHLFFVAAGGLGAAFIMLACSIEDQVRRSRMAVWSASFLGRISYTVYLFHLLVIFALFQELQGWNLAERFLLFIAVTVAVTWSFYVLVERPILRNRPALK